MDAAMQDPAAQDPAAMPAETAMPEETAGDMSQGYVIELSVLPDGTFKVSGPEPLEVEAAEEEGAPGSEMGEDFASIGDALKGVLMMIKQNPVGGDDQQQFEAGYASR